jgi:hypothetical protein
MSYIFLREREEESSAECFSDIPAYVLLRLNLTAEKFCCNDSGMASYPSSPSGMMSKPSMENRGKGKLTLCAEGSRVRIFRRATQLAGKQLHLSNYFDGAPCPSCVENMMDWPIGQTDLEPLAMVKFQQWLSSHGKP